MKYIKLFENYQDLSFRYLLTKVPDELRVYIERLKDIQQRPDIHTEGDAFVHTEIVVNRLSQFNDINLSLAGLFHDLGKHDVHWFNDEKSFFQHIGHEEESLKFVDEFKDWIEEMGADFDTVYGIVQYHGKIKLFNEMRRSKQEKIKALPFYEDLLKFKTCDKGGFD